MPLGRMLILLGALLVVVGALISLGIRVPFRPGQLPGDLVVRGRNSTFYFPVATCVLISILLSVVMWLLGRR